MKFTREVLHIDLESIIIATSYANSDNDDLEDYKINLINRVISIIYDYFQMQGKELHEVQDTNVNFYLDEGKSFRYRNEKYKSNRQRQKFPFKKELKNFAKKELKALSLPLLEADDLIGLNRDNNVIIANDDDFLTMPGKVYNYRKKQFYNIDHRNANYNLAFKMLTGGHNNSTSLENCGKKTAEKFLSNFDLLNFFDTLEVVKEAFLYGIKKENYSVHRDVEASSIKNFFLSFRENYILRNISDIYLLEIDVKESPIKCEILKLNELINLKDLYEL